MTRRALPVAPAVCRTVRQTSLVPVARGGPDPTRPCDGCPARRTCRAPCELLAAELPPDEIAFDSVSSPALMEGRAMTSQFMSIDAATRDALPAAATALDVEGPPVEAPYLGLLAEILGAAMLDALVRSILTPTQHAVLRELALVPGAKLREGGAHVGRARHVSRQNVHRLKHAGLARLRRAFKTAPSVELLRWAVERGRVGLHVFVVQHERGRVPEMRWDLRCG